MGKKGKNNGNLGRALINDRFPGARRSKYRGDESMIHTSELNDGYDWGRLNLKSVTEESSFQEFLSTAQLAGTEFEAEKLNIKFVKPTVSCDVTSRDLSDLRDEHYNVIKIPRRPPWDSNTTPSELESMERECFLEWRKKLAAVQENEGFLLTPFEKNLEFWRQLWRVIERSDIVLQILDARNPLIFRCPDLELYVKEVNANKESVLLLNKADFLNESQRKAWAKHFDREKVKIIFYSATEAMSDNLKSKDSPSKLLEELSLDDRANAYNSSRIYTSEELVDFLRCYHEAPRVTENKTTVGLVGYPNVGKSSTLNSLLASKKVAVSATPGKTKHFQTFNLSDDIVLCDCPGLVMPSFVSTKSDMIINGILPIDQMRDHVPPIALVASLIPRHVLEDTYSIVLPRPSEGEKADRGPTPEELLNAFGFSRGFMTQNGQPDNPRSARHILKDFISGKLLYCRAPPGLDQNLYHRFPEAVKSRSLEKAPRNYVRAVSNTGKQTTENIDSVFFNSRSGGVHEKGIPKILKYSRMLDSDAKALVENRSGSKPWKQHNRHANKNKKEKLRRVYAALDRH